MEVENEDKSLAFMNVKTTNNRQGSYEFQVYRKKAITNVQVKPESSHDPKILSGIFKGFVHQAHKICSPHHLENELDFIIKVFQENGYEEHRLRKWLKEVQDKINETHESTSLTTATANEEPTQTITLPWIPGVSPSLKKVFRKAGYKVTFKANPNLMTILTKKNKVKLPANSYPGVYKIPCQCGVPPYIGKTKLRTNTRIDQHKEYVNKGQWDRSGAAQHARTCQMGPLFEASTTLKTDHRSFERSVREALEIQRHRSAPRFSGINKDEGQYLKTTFWMPYMDMVSKEEKERDLRRQRRNEQQNGRNGTGNGDNGNDTTNGMNNEMNGSRNGNENGMTNGTSNEINSTGTGNGTGNENDTTN